MRSFSPLALLLLTGCFDRLEIHYDVDVRHQVVHATEHLRNLTLDSSCDSVAACLEALKADLAAKGDELKEGGAINLSSTISVRDGEVDYAFSFDQPFNSVLFSGEDPTALAQVVTVQRGHGRERRGLLLRREPSSTEQVDVTVTGPALHVLVPRPGAVAEEQWLLFRGHPQANVVVSVLSEGVPAHNEPWLATIPGLTETLTTLQLAAPKP